MQKPLTVVEEQSLTIVELAKTITPRPHVNTLRRWATRGIRGARLRTWLVGGRRCSSLRAWEEFSACLNGAPASAVAHLEAEAELDRLGV